MLPRHPLLALGALVLLLLTPPAQTQAQTPDKDHWGINGHPIMNGHDEMSQTSYTDISIAAQLDLVADLGAGWYRIGIRAEDLATKAARFEELLTEAERRKIRLLPVLLSSASFWDGSATVNQIRTTGAAFAREIVGRYKGRITHWELGNELDNYALLRKGETGRDGKLWSWDEAPEGSRVEDYDDKRFGRVAAQIIGFHEGVKAADPSAVTVVDTAGWFHYGLIDRFVNEEKVRPFDVLSWHWYSHMGSITNVQGRMNMIEHLKRYGVPLWMTEINLHSSQMEDQAMADYIRTTVAELGKNPAIQCIFIYELLTQPYHQKAEACYGLVEVERAGAQYKIKRQRPGFTAYHDIITGTTTPH